MTTNASKKLVPDSVIHHKPELHQSSSEDEVLKSTQTCIHLKRSLSNEFEKDFKEQSCMTTNASEKVVPDSVIHHQPELHQSTSEDEVLKSTQTCINLKRSLSNPFEKDFKEQNCMITNASMRVVPDSVMQHQPELHQSNNVIELSFEDDVLKSTQRCINLKQSLSNTEVRAYQGATSQDSYTCIMDDDSHSVSSLHFSGHVVDVSPGSDVTSPSWYSENSSGASTSNTKSPCSLTQSRISWDTDLISNLSTPTSKSSSVYEFDTSLDSTEHSPRLSSLQLNSATAKTPTKVKSKVNLGKMGKMFKLAKNTWIFTKYLFWEIYTPAEREDRSVYSRYNCKGFDADVIGWVKETVLRSYPFDVYKSKCNGVIKSVQEYWQYCVNFTNRCLARERLNKKKAVERADMI